MARRIWAGLIVAAALTAGVGAGVEAAWGQGTAPASATTAADSAAAASEATEYHDELMAAAASLKADIRAESDASAAEVADTQSGPTSLGMIVAGGIVIFAILAAVFVIPASLRARKRRREVLTDMLSGKPPRKR